MKICELLEIYNFHDSLVEEIVHAEEKIQIRIDFCNWKQDGYKDGDEETKEMSLIFENVYHTDIPAIKPNSDEIIDVKEVKNNESETGIELLLFNDIKGTTYSVVIFAKSVSIS